MALTEEEQVAANEAARNNPFLRNQYVAIDEKYDADVESYNSAKESAYGDYMLIKANLFLSTVYGGSPGESSTGPFADQKTNDTNVTTSNYRDIAMRRSGLLDLAEPTKGQLEFGQAKTNSVQNAGIKVASGGGEALRNPLDPSKNSGGKNIVRGIIGDDATNALDPISAIGGSAFREIKGWF